MCNLTITTENYNTQSTLPLEVNEDSSSSKRTLAPTFKPYNNHQIQMIFDIEELIPEHHVARVIDEMVEAISDKKCFPNTPAASGALIILK
ncbi:hypothetical protein [Metabacillus idriensis]|uniref:hypothetical protein n=1 Tax=Metabacillus idriensis TaxID=324768 RepID=UPI001749128B|nr:hypothetical protein [Metabacillus idriensis]